MTLPSRQDINVYDSLDERSAGIMLALVVVGMSNLLVMVAGVAVMLLYKITLWLGDQEPITIGHLLLPVD